MYKFKYGSGLGKQKNETEPGIKESKLQFLVEIKMIIDQGMFSYKLQFTKSKNQRKKAEHDLSNFFERLPVSLCVICFGHITHLVTKSSSNLGVSWPYESLEDPNLN